MYKAKTDFLSYKEGEIVPDEMVQKYPNWRVHLDYYPVSKPTTSNTEDEPRSTILDSQLPDEPKPKVTKKKSKKKRG